MKTNEPTYYQIICPKCGKIYYDSRIFYTGCNEAAKYCQFCGVNLITKHSKCKLNLWQDKPE